MATRPKPSTKPDRREMLPRKLAGTKAHRCGDYGHTVTRNGQKVPCRKWVVAGATVCTRHGGKAPQVIRRAKERQLEALKELIDPERVLRAMADLAYFDLRAVFDEAGNLLPVAEWPEGLGRSLAAIETVKRNLDHADGVVDQVVKIKPYDKLKALEMLAKHLGLLTERVEHSGGLEVSWKDDGGE